MTSIYPKQPGYQIYHDPTKVDFKKISSLVLQRIQNGEVKVKKDYPLPRQIDPENINFRDGPSLSYSQSIYVNHYDVKPPKEHFQPDWVKLDKQVLRFKGYFKESVSESKVEYARIRKLTIFYYLVDDTIEMIEDRENNSGLPQGSFLMRGKIRKDSDKISNINEIGSSNFYHFKDFQVGKDVYVYGKYIKIYECDTYSREFYSKVGIYQPENISIPIDAYRKDNMTKFVPKKDNLMKDFLEHMLGGGRVKNQKQFLENDRRVLVFNAKHDNLKYIINYYLADDTVEIKELHFPNSGRDAFPLFLKRNKLPKKFSVTQPGEVAESDYVTPADIEVKYIDSSHS